MSGGMYVFGYKKYSKISFSESRPVASTHCSSVLHPCNFLLKVSSKATEICHPLFFFIPHGDLYQFLCQLEASLKSDNQMCLAKTLTHVLLICFATLQSPSPPLSFHLRPLQYDISSGGNLLASSVTGPVPSSAEGGGALLWISLGTKEQIMLIHLGPPSVRTCKHKFKVNILTIVQSLHQEKSDFFFFYNL